MIKVDANNYYYCSEGEQEKKIEPKPVVQQSHQFDKPLEIMGDIKGYLKTVAIEVQKIKALRIEQKKENLNNQLLLEKLNPKISQEQSSSNGWIQLQMVVPEQIYQLDQRLAQIEDKIKNDEVMRQKIQRKGNLTERAKNLNSQIQKLSQKSPQIIANHIQNYTQSLEEKEEAMKTLFLYEAFSKTQGLNEEIQTITAYLGNLASIQSKLKGMPNKSSIVDNHSKVLSKRAKVSAKIAELSSYMKSEYESLIKEIDSL